jgi:hypothetical protein
MPPPRADHPGALPAESPAAAVPARIRHARRAYRLLAWLFAACVVIQVFVAGLAIFVSPAQWASHRAFVHIFELLPLVMLVLAFVGRLPVRTRWLTAAVFGMLILQYATANSGGVLAALHPVTALLLFWAAVTLARPTWRDAVDARPADLVAERPRLDAEALGSEADG